ncbi:MAG: hypothetical protein AAFY88_18980, partial [Acidobacteriota bacterium]
ADQLTQQHLTVIGDSLEALAEPTVAETDVAALEELWKRAGVETIPTLGDAFPEWLELSEPEPVDGA